MRARVRHFAVNRRVRRYHRNPRGGEGRGFTIMGITFPPLDAVLGASVGLLLPGYVANKVIAYVPASMKNEAGEVPSWLKWLIKGASVFVPSFLVRRFVSRRVGNAMLVGGIAGLVVEVVRPMLGLGYQPMLGQVGAYFDRPAAVRQFPRQRQAVGQSIVGTPERLNPANRY